MQPLLPRASVRSAFQTSIRSTHRAGRRLIVAMTSSTTPIYEIGVKGDPDSSILGDCPFTHRALLALEEKHVPYTKTYIDFDNKPEWLFEINPAGTVPILKDLSTGEWTLDSGVIVDMLEQKFPEPKLGTVDSSPQVGNSILGAFKNFAKSTDEDKAEKEAEFVAVLEEIEEYLKGNGGPYIGGAQPCATDVALMPRLYHARTALEHFRGWSFPDKFTAVKAYMDAFMARDSWKNTYYAPEIVVKGWVRHGLEVKK